MQQCILPTAVNNHPGKYKGKAMVAAGQAKRCQSISGHVRRSKEIQRANSAVACRNTGTRRLDCLLQHYRSLYINYMAKSFSGREIGVIDVTMPWLHD